MKKFLSLAVLLACTGLGLAYANAQYVRQPAPVQYYVPPPVAPQVPNVRMPGTVHRGIEYVQQPRRGGYYPFQGVPRRYGYRSSHRFHKQQHYYRTVYRRRPMLPVEHPVGVRHHHGPVAQPTGRPYVPPAVTIVENGIRYTGNSCRRSDGSTGREGYNGGQLGCWRF